MFFFFFRIYYICVVGLTTSIRLTGDCRIIGKYEIRVFNVFIHLYHTNSHTHKPRF